MKIKSTVKAGGTEGITISIIWVGDIDDDEKVRPSSAAVSGK